MSTATPARQRDTVWLLGVVQENLAVPACARLTQLCRSRPLTQMAPYQHHHALPHHHPAPCSVLCSSCRSWFIHAFIHPSVFLQILDGDKYLWAALGSGLWPVMVLVSEIVQTFILADFW